MKDLTQQEAERCARALKWTYVDNGAMEYWAPPGAGSGDVPIWVRVWSDPHFWFPRLWDRLKDAAYNCQIEWNREGQCLVRGLTTGKQSHRPIKFIKVGETECPALCEAIEALEDE